MTDLFFVIFADKKEGWQFFGQLFGQSCPPLNRSFFRHNHPLHGKLPGNIAGNIPGNFWPFSANNSKKLPTAFSGIFTT